MYGGVGGRPSEKKRQIVFAAWSIDDQPDGTVKVSLAHELAVAQLDVPLVERMVNWVLDKAVAEIDALQATYGGKRPVVVTEEPPSMPTGPETMTVTGRYPGYEPVQAMATFFSVPGQPSRPSYQEERHSWLFNGGGYALVVGCFAEPDGTPVIAVTYLAESDDFFKPAWELLMREKSALEQSAHSTDLDIFGEDGIRDAVASGRLRQLRPSEIRAVSDSKREGPAPAEVPDLRLRFDGLYRAQELSGWSYLRFYADGTVLQASTSGNPEQVARWFDKTHTDVPRGTYIVRDQSIEFSVMSSEGTVAYKGQMFDDNVELSSHSYISGHKAQRTFSFVKVALY